MTDVGPGRVSRFEWEQLMMMSDLPAHDRFRLLALGIFMDLSGKGVLPSTADLAAFGPTENAWESLVHRAVNAGWLTRIDASRYAVSAPRDVWGRRAGVSR